jgi:hypothetical protein
VAFAALAVQLGDLRAVFGEQLDAGDVAVRGRFAGHPDLIHALFAQMQGKGGVEDIQPAAHRGHLFQRAGEDLHAAAVADENHDLVALLADGFQQARQRRVSMRQARSSLTRRKACWRDRLYFLSRPKNW